MRLCWNQLALVRKFRVIRVYLWNAILRPVDVLRCIWHWCLAMLLACLLVPVVTLVPNGLANLWLKLVDWIPSVPDAYFPWGIHRFRTKCIVFVHASSPTYRLWMHLAIRLSCACTCWTWADVRIIDLAADLRRLAFLPEHMQLVLQSDRQAAQDMDQAWIPAKLVNDAAYRRRVKDWFKGQWWSCASTADQIVMLGWASWVSALLPGRMTEGRMVHIEPKAAVVNFIAPQVRQHSAHYGGVFQVDPIGTNPTGHEPCLAAGSQLRPLFGTVAPRTRRFGWLWRAAAIAHPLVWRGTVAPSSSSSSSSSFASMALNGTGRCVMQCPTSNINGNSSTSPSTTVSTSRKKGFFSRMFKRGSGNEEREGDKANGYTKRRHMQNLHVSTDSIDSTDGGSPIVYRCADNVPINADPTCSPDIRSKGRRVGGSPIVQRSFLKGLESPVTPFSKRQLQKQYHS